MKKNDITPQAPEPTILFVVEVEIERGTEAISYVSWYPVEFGAFVSQQEDKAKELMGQFETTYPKNKFRISRYLRV